MLEDPLGLNSYTTIVIQLQSLTIAKEQEPMDHEWKLTRDTRDQRSNCISRDSNLGQTVMSLSANKGLATGRVHGPTQKPVGHFQCVLKK